MLIHVLFAIYVLAASIIFALLEVQIEGGQGWATGLPTWRLENRWTRLFFGGRPLTGYHLYVHLLMLYALGLARPSWAIELRLLAFLMLFFIIEDFLWFLFNPRFGLARFRREHVWWHAHVWWWIMPRDYWLFFPLGVVFYVLSWNLH